MDAALRRATEADIPDLARLFIMAADGIVDAVYHDLVPGLALEKIFEWRFSQFGTVLSYEYCWVAQDGLQVAGMVNAYPIDHLADAPSDPRLTADRLAVFRPFETLREQAAGSYYINLVAVYPEWRGKGIGHRLIGLATSDAQQQGLTELSLIVFEQNSRAVALYRRLGFEISARSQVAPHRLIRRTGDLVLMKRRL